jgi:photosystem I subunit 2|uniref:Photosystem I reaction center subunit II n=1 Tax=Poterioochromonas malhamensis TaxID=88167 RepID=A0A7T6Y8G4_9STRA|nr:subunit II of photosystem I (ferredoxin-binding protein) [Poterioochromonas malhamensis]QQK55089.1 subunit II of photosystem I (ferredoxin-binding protein) [Poterioochromonas malhamensis]
MNNLESIYYPNFLGSTSGWLSSAENEEKYLITWTNTKDNEILFEVPIGGCAKMKKGFNLMYFSRKEQCLALGKELKSKYKFNDYRIFRIFPTSEIQFLHPKDGVFPEKVNEGREILKIYTNIV